MPGFEYFDRGEIVAHWREGGIRQWHLPGVPGQQCCSPFRPSLSAFVWPQLWRRSSVPAAAATILLHPATITVAQSPPPGFWRASGSTDRTVQLPVASAEVDGYATDNCGQIGTKVRKVPQRFTQSAKNKEVVSIQRFQHLRLLYAANFGTHKIRLRPLFADSSSHPSYLSQKNCLSCLHGLTGSV
jgi:hypothetical protein